MVSAAKKLYQHKDVYETLKNSPVKLGIVEDLSEGIYYFWNCVII